MPRSTRKSQVSAARERRLALRQRREVGSALDEHWIVTPGRHVRLQIARLTDALRLIEYARPDGRLDAVEPLLKVLDLLDRYNALGQEAPAQPRPALLALTA